MDVKSLPEVNIVNPKLDQIRELGLDLHDNGYSYEAMTYDAQAYANEHMEGHTYTLGCVMGGTESLMNAEFDVCFTMLEHYAGALTKIQYDELHELAHMNNAYGFVKKLMDMGDVLYCQIAEEIYGYMVDIEHELNQIILALGGTITKEEN